MGGLSCWFEGAGFPLAAGAEVFVFSALEDHEWVACCCALAVAVGACAGCGGAWHGEGSFWFWVDDVDFALSGLCAVLRAF